MKKAYFQMHLAILLWGFTGILGKAIGLSEGMIVWYRMIISAIGLLPVLLSSKPALPTGKDLLNISITGLIVALHWVFFYASIKASNVSIALSCFSSVSLFTAILEPLSRRQRPKMAEILLGIMVMVGLYIIFSVQQLYFTGILLAVISALLGATFTILNKTLTSRFEPSVITFYELISGFVLLTALLPVYFHFSNTGFEIPSGTDVIYLILLGLVCTSFAFTLSLKALKKLDAFTLNLSVNLEPLYSIVLAVIFFNETTIKNSGFILGTLIILGSVVLHSWYKWQKTRKEVTKTAL
jgi:drug/metabolite transporter (DMT)-like permease